MMKDTAVTPAQSRAHISAELRTLRDQKLLQAAQILQDAGLEFGEITDNGSQVAFLLPQITGYDRVVRTLEVVLRVSGYDRYASVREVKDGKKTRIGDVRTVDSFVGNKDIVRMADWRDLQIGRIPIKGESAGVIVINPVNGWRFNILNAE